MQDKITIFEVSRSILRDHGVLFTNGNASNQQLSKYRGEKVGIIPATVFGEECQRKYHPNGPYGTGVNRSDFFNDVTFLERLDWDGINNIRYIESLEEYIHVRHAEVLVPDLLPLGRLEGIVVRTRDMVQAVNALIDGCGLAGRLPSAVCKPGLYF